MSWQTVAGADGGRDVARVLVRTSRREMTTSTVIAWRDRAVLIDPAWDADELADIADLLEGQRLAVVAGFATHAHHDHLLWHPRYGSASRWAAPAAAALAHRERPGLTEALGPGFPVELAALAAQVTPATGRMVPWDGPALQLISHDAHAPGHTAVWLAAQRVLVAGDMLSDVELPLPDAGPQALDDYADGLAVLEPFARAAAVLIPGHGTVATDGAVRWAADEQYVTAVRAGGDPADRRRSDPGMARVHAENLRLARRDTGTGPASADLDDGLDLDG